MPLGHPFFRYGLFEAESAALCFCLIGSTAHTAVAYTNAVGRTCTAAVILAALGVTMNLQGALCRTAGMSSWCSSCFLTIRRTAGLAASICVLSPHLNGREAAAALLIMGTGTYLTFQIRHIRHPFQKRL